MVQTNAKRTRSMILGAFRRNKGKESAFITLKGENKLRALPVISEKNRAILLFRNQTMRKLIGPNFENTRRLVHTHPLTTKELLKETRPSYYDIRQLVFTASKKSHIVGVDSTGKRNKIAFITTMAKTPTFEKKKLEAEAFFRFWNQTIQNSAQKELAESIATETALSSIKKWGINVRTMRKH